MPGTEHEPAVTAGQQVLDGPAAGGEVIGEAAADVLDHRQTREAVATILIARCHGLPLCIQKAQAAHRHAGALTHWEDAHHHGTVSTLQDLTKVVAEGAGGRGLRLHHGIDGGPLVDLQRPAGGTACHLDLHKGRAACVDMEGAVDGPIAEGRGGLSHPHALGGLLRSGAGRMPELGVLHGVFRPVPGAQRG